MSLLAICTLATRERIVSLKISSRMAVMAPRPLTKSQGDLSISVETMIRAATRKKTILTTCR